MKFMEKHSDTDFIINLIVKPNSKHQKIIDSGEFLTVLIRSKAKQNKANIELIKLLKNKLNISSNQIKILTGLKSTNKKVQLKFTKTTENQLLYDKLVK
ncbi:MAG: DUF167 domain-containing protein [Promethearchaeota archaeon]|nr:MAG: DUF167 domain-containing protein [Candidatus Lokiarchaeota archaeon]